MRFDFSEHVSAGTLGETKMLMMDFAGIHNEQKRINEGIKGQQISAQQGPGNKLHLDTFVITWHILNNEQKCAFKAPISSRGNKVLVLEWLFILNTFEFTHIWNIRDSKSICMSKDCNSKKYISERKELYMKKH